jgi:hypothetical protein
MLCTAQAYADKQNVNKQQAYKLAHLVCCTDLPELWLSAALLSDDESMLLLRELKRLQLLRSGCSTDVDLGREDLEK